MDAAPLPEPARPGSDLTWDDLPLRYTLCFLTRPGQVLMLHRQRPPNQGLWNGVGGHLEAGEAPLASCLREVREETGYVLTGARFGGLLTWNGFETPAGGLYLFHASAPPDDPLACSEGPLVWQDDSWVLHSPQVVSNIPYVLPSLLAGDAPRVFHFEYRAGVIVHHTILPLPAWVDVDRPNPLPSERGP
jgi:8-oxo-dGTP diphosphatase